MQPPHSTHATPSAFDEEAYLGDPARRAPFAATAKVAVEQMTARLRTIPAPFTTFTITCKEERPATHSTVHVQREVWLELRELLAARWATSRVDADTIDVVMHKMDESAYSPGRPEPPPNKHFMYGWGFLS